MSPLLFAKMCSRRISSEIMEDFPYRVPIKDLASTMTSYVTLKILLSPKLVRCGILPAICKATVAALRLPRPKQKLSVSQPVKTLLASNALHNSVDVLQYFNERLCYTSS